MQKKFYFYFHQFYKKNRREEKTFFWTALVRLASETLQPCILKILFSGIYSESSIIFAVDFIVDVFRHFRYLSACLHRLNIAVDRVAFDAIQFFAGLSFSVNRYTIYTRKIIGKKGTKKGTLLCQKYTHNSQNSQVFLFRGLNF